MNSYINKNYNKNRITTLGFLALASVMLISTVRVNASNNETTDREKFKNIEYVEQLSNKELNAGAARLIDSSIDESFKNDLAAEFELAESIDTLTVDETTTESTTECEIETTYAEPVESEQVEAEPNEVVETNEQAQVSENDYIKVRCTGYCDYGVTKSGEWTRPGGVAGKPEWLGKKCYVYEVDSTGNCGKLIKVYTFNDTGFGLKNLDGVYYKHGTIKAGKSIDIWHESADAVWEWASKYGDYVYIKVV